MKEDRPPKNKFEEIMLYIKGFWWGIGLVIATILVFFCICLIDPIIRYFKWHKEEKKPVYDWEEVKARLKQRKEKTFQNLLLDIYYWFIRNFRWIWEPAIVKGYLVRACQRCTRGWSDRDLWSLDYTIANFALPRLIRLKEIKHGVPTSFFPPDKYEHTQEEYDEAQRKWNEVMDKMIWSMDFIANNREWDYYPDTVTSIDDYSRLKEAEERMQEGLDLFAKYFRNLWD